jgi:hypothetical protein
MTAKAARAMRMVERIVNSSPVPMTVDGAQKNGGERSTFH